MTPLCNTENFRAWSVTGGTEVARSGRPQGGGSSALDPGRVETQKGCLRRGIAFYRRCEFRVVLLSVARTLRSRGRSFYAFLTPRCFRTAKTPTRHRPHRNLAVQQALT